MLLCILNILDLTNFKFTEIPVYFPKKGARLERR